ncbi:HNH endonuclease [Streptomyces sp. NPDC088768]|uniref:HNH endonuclease n=1 Tax=Streptomyces sp. NPDC088768 TaxID=3365894 RepID=UPI003800003B
MANTRDRQHMPTRVRASVARNRARSAIARGRSAPRRQPRPPVRAGDVFPRWGGCCYCSGPAEHLDHVTPLSRGGADTLSNVVPACAECNLSKAALSLAEWAATF